MPLHLLFNTWTGLVHHYLSQRDLFNPKGSVIRRYGDELLEHFLWVENEASREVVHDKDELQEVADEMADVACYLLALSNTLGIDLSDAILGKLAKNAIKYPAPTA